MKIIFKSLIVIGVVFTSFGIAYPDIAIVTNLTNREAKAQETVLEGFKKVISDNNQSNNMELTYYDLAEVANPSEVLSKIKNSSPEMIVTLGFQATNLLQKEIDSIPIVFSMIMNPVERGLVDSMENPGSNLTGVTLNMPVQPQFELIKNIFPDIESIGIIYDPSNSSRIIEEADNVSNKLGLTLVKYSISEPKEISEGMEHIDSEGAEIIWALPDSTVYSGASVRQVLLFSLRNKIPVSGFSKSFVKAGALMGTYHDYESIGKQTAEHSLKVLSGQDPRNIPLAVPRKMVYSLNRRVINNFGINVDNNIIEEAEQIFE